MLPYTQICITVLNVCAVILFLHQQRSSSMAIDCMSTIIITHDLLVMDWHFKDILCLVVLLLSR